MFTVPLVQGAFLLRQLQVIRGQVLGIPIVNRRTQLASASNRNVITGNLGAVRTGVQNASPLNVA